jgi:hypothetical protein
MTTPWILIVYIMTPAGQYVEKIPVDMPSRTACQQAMYNLPRRSEDLTKFKYQGKCVTADHWTGKRVMKDVPLD